MSIRYNLFFDKPQFIQSSVYGCEFRNCSKVIIAGSVDKCTFINCDIVGICGSCYNSKFINCTDISIKRLCNNSNFKNCEYILVSGMIEDCIRDGKLYDDGYYTAPKYIPNDASAPDNI